MKKTVSGIIFLLLLGMHLGFAMAEFERPPLPLLKVMPEETTGKILKKTFEIDIMLMDENHEDLDSEWDVAGFDMTLNFNETLIQGLSVTVDPDEWFSSFWPNGIFVVKQEIDNVAGKVWIAFLGITGEYAEHTPPFGQGRLATITFNATFESLTYPTPWCNLTLAPTIISLFPHIPPWIPGQPIPPEENYVIPVIENGRYYAPLKGGHVDINFDGEVNIQDIVIAASIYGCKEGDPNWNPFADLAPPYGKIDILDLVTCAYRYGERYP